MSTASKTTDRPHVSPLVETIRQENTAWKISQATNNDGDVSNDVLRGQTRLINYPHLSVVYLW